MPARMMMSCALLVQGNQEIAPFMAPVWEENTEDFQLRQLMGQGEPNADQNAGATTTTTTTPAPQQPAADQQNAAPQPQQREGGNDQGNNNADPPAGTTTTTPATDSAWALSAIVPLMMTMLQW